MVLHKNDKTVKCPQNPFFLHLLGYGSLFVYDGVGMWWTYFQVRAEGEDFCGYPPAPGERWAGEGAEGGCCEEAVAVASNALKLEDTKPHEC